MNLMRHSDLSCINDKIMTTIVVFDLLKNQLSLDDKFVVSEKCLATSLQSGYSSMFIMVNDEVSVEDLLKGIIIVPRK